MAPLRLVRGRTPAPLLLTVALLLTAQVPASGQSVLDRPANLGGTWKGAPGTVHFHFLHRFTATGPPLRKVVSYPTFLLGAGLPGDLLVGARYATNSELVPEIPNEWELFARRALLEQAAGSPLDVTLSAAYNDAARSGDAEVTVARRVGERLRLMASGRYFSDAFARDEDRWAWGAGAVLRLSRRIAVAADYARLLDLDEALEEAAWSGALQLEIPYTPHSLSLQASNATTATLQGSSLGVPEIRWGFEFTVPITLSRYFRGNGDGGDTAADRAARATLERAGEGA